MTVLILAILVGLAIAAVRTRDLLASTAALGAYSLMMALLWCSMNALDVAFTEAAVGAGISTVLMLAAITRIGRVERGKSHSPLLRRPLMTMRDRVAIARSHDEKHHRHTALAAALVCIMVALMLVYATQDMPQVGDAASPANSNPKVAQYYIKESPHEVGPSNIVTSVLGDYRGYDTMGETVVIFTAALCVLMLLRARGRGGRSEDA